MPSCSLAASPTPSGLAVQLNGSYMGDADYDVSKVMGGEFTTSGQGRTLTGRLHLQKRGLDNLGSDLSFVSLSADGTIELQVLHFRVIPYVSTGISYGRIALETLGRDDDDPSATLLQFGAGVGIPFSSGMTLEARYRYFAPVESAVKVGGTPIDMDIGKHNLLLGLRFSF
ncbi:MAG: outer membrane beta-barrel protein [Chlorobiaceae bacterium]|nr:outer membrane beta-barrel protein [Chlorobiaceae bacterium]NTW74631.1 outer membrane beta-barrel protein [Chlorobiaceae bacterium]